MGLRLNFGVGPLRASVPLTGRRRRAPARRRRAPARTAAPPAPFVSVRGEVAAARPGALLVRIISGDFPPGYGGVPLLAELAVPNAPDFAPGLRVDACWRRDNGTVLWVHVAEAAVTATGLRPATIKRLGEGWKHCPACDRDLPLDAFYRDRGRADGRFQYCRSCWRPKARMAYRRRKAAREAAALAGAG